MKIKKILKWFLLLIVVTTIGWLFISYWTSTNNCEQITNNVTHPMKAILSCEYGVGNLQLREIEKPTPADDEVLVRVRATSVNPADGHLIRDTWMTRLMGGMRKPRNTRFGTDFAGVVEMVGKNVTDFKPGDEVFGAKNGAAGDYICVKDERAIALKPANVTFEQAGSVGIAGITALQGLRDKGRIQRGQKVLINGASGGVGTFAVQIAKAFGAEVTAVCSTHNVDLMKSIGADHVIDYTREDFTDTASPARTDQRYDVIYDLVSNHSFSERRKIMTSDGICVLAGIGGAGWHPETMGRIAANFWNAFRSKFTKQKFVFYISKLTKDDLNVLREMMESGKVNPVIDRTYKIEQTADAVRYMEEGHARGKVVITVMSDPATARQANDR